MPTAKQRAASRANSQKSTGPRSAAGKAVSRFNALKHGIFAVHQLMFDEKAEDLADLSAEYHEHHHPADSKQLLLVEALVHNEWRLRRMRRVEAHLWYHAYDAFVVKNIEITLTCTSGEAFATYSATFERLQRVVNSCERAYHRALKELESLQEVARGHALRSPQPAPIPQPEQSKPVSTSSASFRQNPQAPAPAASSCPTPEQTLHGPHPPTGDRGQKPPQKE